MKLIKCTSEEIETLAYRKTCNQIILEEFIESNMNCARVENYKTKKAKYCVATLRASIKRYGFHGVDAILRKEKVYLIRTDR